MNTGGEGSRRSPADVDAKHHIRHAADAQRATELQRCVEASKAAEAELRTTIQAAVYDRGISWQSIGDALGISRASAYQRFRRPDRTRSSDSG